MFDIGFWELCLVGVVALLVFGPERLPSVARNIGLWTGRFRHLMHNVKDDFDRELRLQELRQLEQSLKQSHPLQQLTQTENLNTPAQTSSTRAETTASTPSESQKV
jgi:sec-independent protein translocase protein TatB